MAKRGRRKRRSGSTLTQPAASSSSAAQETEGPSHRASRFVDGALPILQSAIKVAFEAAGDAAVPGLSIGLAALNEILEQIKTMRKTVEGVHTLEERITKLSELITEFYSRPQTLPEGTKKRIKVLSETWEDVAKRTKHIASRGRVKRFFLAKSDAEKLEGFVQGISDSIQQDFLIGSLLTIEVGVAQANENILGFRKDMRVLLEESFMSNYAKGAQFDANNVRRGCLEGTRVELLEALRKWITAVCFQKGLSSVRIVYWINGLAGTGKTTIAWSIAAWCRERGLLGASFCCSRFDSECSDPNFVFRTISRQLCNYFGPFRDKVVEILAKDSTLVHSGAARQFEELILRPLEELKCDFPRCVIVIDALDECKDPDTISVILSIIAKFIPRIARFLVFVITSRPERRITHLFDSNQDGTLKTATTPFLLHMVTLASVLDDIHRYMEKTLAEVRDYFGLIDWPTSLQLSKLVELSAGLFIWAATAILFIKDDTVSNPRKQLKALLDFQALPQTTERASHTILDPLYTQILQAAFSRISQALAADLNPILGTIALAQEPVSVVVLAALTDIDPDDVRCALIGLRSVLHIPDNNNEPIRIIHPTFAEYLLRPPSSKSELFSTDSTAQQSPSISKLESFSIDAATQHARLLSRTLGIIRNVKANIADFPTPSTLRSEVTGLLDIVKERIPAALSYSCRHWGAHLEQCNDAECIWLILDVLNTFFYERLLNWLEISSLLGVLDESIASLQVARTACQGYGDSFVSLSELIFDCLRFTQTYAPRIHDAPLQLYHCLVALTPEGSLVKQQYARGLDQSLSITRGALPDWGPCIDTIVGHNGAEINSVSFSADGAHFVTGGDDGYIRIWRTATRTSVKAIAAGDGYHQAAFSPNGRYIASAPDPRIWDVKTGDVVHTLEHENANYVAYSADGTRLASGSDGEIKLWDPLNETCLDTVTSVRAGYFNGMAISPDGTLIGGNTAEDHAAICNISSKVPEVFDQEKNGYVAAFSPDGLYVASCTSETVKIWTLKDKLLVRTIDTSNYVCSVAFSHSSTQIGCGCLDGRVRIWTVASDDPPHVLAGHNNGVHALAWSPDDTQVISGGFDGTIRVWDLTRHRSDTTLAASPPSSLPPIPGAPCYAVLRTPETTALFSLPAPIQPSTAASDAAEDAPVITLYADMADAWDAILRGGGASSEFAASRDWAFLTGRLHANMVENWPVAMTLDGSLFAYEHAFGALKVYSHRAGKHCLSLKNPSSAFALSSDNTRLAIAFYDSRTLGIWELTSQSNSPISQFELSNSSKAIALSHDGDLLVAGTEDSNVHIYDTETGQSIKHLHGTRGVFRRITFSADDRHVIAQAHPWLIIWDATTGDQILEFTPTHHHLLHSFDFTADDTGVLVPDGKGGTTRVTLWSPGKRTWPVYAVTGDGWLYAKGPGKVRRLCWLPPEWRTVFSQGGPKLCALDFERKRTVVFDVSRIPEYVEAWGAESEGVLT